MKLTYFGHSAFQIETDGTTLLFDPFITGNPHAEGVVTPDDLSPDVILMTHAHGDHWGDTPSILKRTGALLIANYEITTYARHSSSFPDGTYGGNPNGFLLQIEGKTVYNTGDTCRFAEMAWTGEDYALDLCLLPIGDDFTMGPAEAVRCVRDLDPKLTVPLHYGTFPVLTGDPDDFARQMDEAGRKARVMEPGETITL
jgi:L-ascorbate metabolism protein UlaG (beta-lactamase superfamily)